MAVRVDEAPFEKVTNVVVEQDVVGRIFGFGDVRFDTDGTAFKGVKNPVEVKRRVEEALEKAARKKDGGHPSSTGGDTLRREVVGSRAFPAPSPSTSGRVTAAPPRPCDPLGQLLPSAVAAAQATRPHRPSFSSDISGFPWHLNSLST